MNEVLLTDLAISRATGGYVAIYADAREIAPFGRQLSVNIMISEVMLEQLKMNETLFSSWLDTESQYIVQRFAMKGSLLGLDVNVPDILMSLREQLANGLKQFCGNDMPWRHVFYIVKTIKPGETFIDDTRIDLENLESTCKEVYQQRQ